MKITITTDDGVVVDEPIHVPDENCGRLAPYQSADLMIEINEQLTRGVRMQEVDREH